MVVVAAGIRYLNSVEEYNDAPPEIQAKFERAVLNQWRGKPMVVISGFMSYAGFPDDDGTVHNIRYLWRDIKGSRMATGFDTWSEHKV